jgi:hypothetical protein
MRVKNKQSEGEGAMHALKCKGCGWAIDEAMTAAAIGKLEKKKAERASRWCVL